MSDATSRGHPDDDFEPASTSEPAEPRPITRPVRHSRKANASLPASDPDRSPPHSQEAEEHVIACCLLDGGVDGTGNPVCPTFDRAVGEGLKPDTFYFPANRLLFEILGDIHASQRVISLEVLAEELKTRRQLEAIGGFAYLMQVTGKIPTTAHAGYFIEKVREKHLLREAIKAHTAAVEDAYNFTGNLDEFLQISKARVEAVGSATLQARKADAARALAAHRVSASNPPSEPTTRLFLADKPISTAGNITTLISRAKTGKTAALGAATAAIISAAAGTSALARDTFKFRASNPEGHAVIVIDTEQSPYDAYLCYQRSLKRAGDETDPPWLHHYALVGYTVAELHQALDLALATAVEKHGGVFAVVLDGVADFVNSVNDEGESNALVTHLRKRTVEFSTPIICVIHSNEAEKSGDDGRGHLGKQLIRKAESNLLLKKTGEITSITSDKQRKAPITAQDGVAFRWSDADGMHVSCEPGEAQGSGKAKGGRTAKHRITEFLECIPAKDKPGMTGGQLHRVVSQISDIKLNTFKDLLNTAASDGDLIREFDEKKGYSYRRAL